MDLLSQLSTLDQLIPIPQSTNQVVQPDLDQWNRQVDSLEDYMELQPIDQLIQSTAKIIVGHGIDDSVFQVLAKLLKTRYYSEYEEETGDLAGDILQKGLISNVPGFHRIMVEKIHRLFGRFSPVTLEALLDQYDQEGKGKEIIYFAYRYALDPFVAEHILILPGAYPTQQELYSGLRQIGSGLPIIQSTQPIPSDLLSAISQKDPVLRENIDTIVSIGHYRDQLSHNGRLSQILGPSNPSDTCYFIPVLNQGGERMLFDYYYDPEQDNDCYISIDWFIGQCENTDCLCPIEQFWQAKRIPMPEGGWRGCFCSFNCAKLAASQMEDLFDQFREDNVDQLVQIEEDRYLPEQWVDLFDGMDEIMEANPIIPRSDDNDSIDILDDVFSRLGHYLSLKYPQIDPTWFDSPTVIPFLGYSAEDSLDISTLPDNSISS